MRIDVAVSSNGRPKNIIGRIRAEEGEVVSLDDIEQPAGFTEFAARVVDDTDPKAVVEGEWEVIGDSLKVKLTATLGDIGAPAPRRSRKAKAKA